jgi:Gas vesicle synthesis protein GvpL/GvpF/Lsr2
MAIVRVVTLACDMCGEGEDVKTWLFELDGRAYEIDLCREDGNGLAGVAAGYIAKARKVTARAGRQHYGGRRHVRGAIAARGDGGGARLAAAGGGEARAAGSKQAATAGRSALRNADAVSARAGGGAGVRPRKGIYVYGILPADIEVTAGILGVGEHPGLLRVVRFDGLAALVSEVEVAGRLGSADDVRIYREILDATAVEVPVVPLPFGTVLASEDAAAGELLAARHDEFAAALEQLEGRAQFRVKGRYVKAAVLGEVVSRDKRAARLREASHGQHPDAARKARLELGQLLAKAVTASREQDTRAVRRAMDGLCVASAAREPARELDAVDMAFLVALNQERDVERAIEDLARRWQGRIEIQLLGPMAAYDFAGTAQPGN